MVDAVVKPVKTAVIRNPKKGYIRKVTPEEMVRYEEREERLKKEGKK